ncbi:MAG: arginine--tRNA ligase [Alphaproteobacteria bacterium]
MADEPPHCSHGVISPNRPQQGAVVFLAYGTILPILRGMSLFEHLRTHIHTSLGQLQGQGVLPAGLDFSNVALEQPKDATHGDLATNAAMVLAKGAGTNPRALAEKLAPLLASHPAVAKVDIAGPGFMNITLADAALLAEMQAVDANYANVNVGKGGKVMVEFVSINPTGPIHVGHGRNAVLGDTLARLLAATGYEVYREYLVNDAGNQIRTLALSVHARYCSLLGRETALPADGYVGDYIIEIAEALKARDGIKWLAVTDEETVVKELRAFCVEACMAMIRSDLDFMGIYFDRFHSEHAMHAAGDPLATAVAALRAKGYVYEGLLPPPKKDGIVPEDYEPAELTLFKATAFGAETDKPIYNRRGQATYFGQDIAYHQNKLERGFRKLATVIDVRQVGNFTPLTWAVEALTGVKGAVHPVYYALVKAMRDGVPVKLSKRAGNIVALRDVLEEVGVDAYRFHMLTRKPESELVFDLAKAVEKSMENPVFYVQYAHARMAAVFRQQAEMGLNVVGVKPDAATLAIPTARALIRQIVMYPMVLEKAAVAMEPHRMAFYAQDFSAAFHGWYSGEKFLLAENLPATAANLVLVRAAQVVLADVLALLGVAAPDKM